jgi:hypothetical protein
MKKYISLVAVTMVLTLVPLLSANVIIKSIMGEVVYQKAGSSKWEKAKVNLRLVKGDIVMTKDKSSVVLAFLDEGGMASLSENSKLLISENEKKSSTPSFLLFAGNVKGKISKKQDVSVNFNTPTAVVGVRGTEFIIAVAEEGTARVGVSEGIVAVTGMNEEVEVKAGEGSTVPLAGEPQDKVAFTGQENFSLWLSETKKSVKGREKEILSQVERALERNYSRIDELLAKSEENLAKVESLKKERTELQAKGDEKNAEAKGNEALALIGERTRILLATHNLDFQNQAIFEIAQRLLKSKKKDKEFLSKYQNIKKRYDFYHSKFVLTKQKKGCFKI